MNLKSAFFEPLSKPYYFMAVNAGLLQLHKNVLLMVRTPVCSAKLLTFRTKTTFQTLLYMVLWHRSAQHSVPDDCSFQKSRGAHPFCSVFQTCWYLPTRYNFLIFLDMFVRITLKHSCVTRDSGLSTISDLSQAMASRDEWRNICNVAGVDVDASTVST